ncbi:hypothetical protein ACVGW3_06110, partial [Enterobacter hormaechei]
AEGPTPAPFPPASAKKKKNQQTKKNPPPPQTHLGYAHNFWRCYGLYFKKKNQTPKKKKNKKTLWPL